jgi:hypothetical protein
MVAKISRDLIESHLNCRYKASLKRRGHSGTKVDFETLMSEIQDEVRQAFVAKTILDRPDDFIPNGVEVSVPTLMRGSSYLFNAMLIDDHAELLFDGLQKKAGASKLGDFHYLPMLLTHAKKPVQHSGSCWKCLARFWRGFGGELRAGASLFMEKLARFRKSSFAPNRLKPSVLWWNSRPIMRRMTCPS